MIMAEISNKTKEHLDNLVEAIDSKMDRKLDEREVSWKKNQFKSSGKSMGLSKTLNKELDSIKAVVSGKYHSHSFSVKAADITEGSGSGSYILEDYGGSRISTRDYLDISQYFPQYVCSGGITRFVTESSQDSNFAIVAEGSAATQSDVQFKEVNVAPETIRSYGVMSEELLSDSANLEQFVRNRFVQQLLDIQNNELINGSGTINSLNANSTDIPTDSSLVLYQSVESANVIDCLKAAITQLSYNGFACNLIVMAVKDFNMLFTAKDSQNLYLSQNAGLQRISNDIVRMGNVDIVASNRLSADDFYAMDTRKFGTIVRKDSWDFKISSDGKNALINNVAYLRLSSRINLAAFNTACNYKAAISTLKTALETP